MNTPSTLGENFSLKEQRIDFSPPYILRKKASFYSVVFNLFGVDRRDISIDVDEDKREIKVMACKRDINYQKGYYWVFGVPRDAFLEEASVKFGNGVLEIVIPRSFKPLLGAFASFYVPKYDSQQTRAAC